jgi:hypothetical protein
MSKQENWVVSDEGDNVVVAESGSLVAQIWREEYAPLISAAPDLLEAIEAAMRIEVLWLPPYGNSYDDEGETQCLHDMHGQFKAAIAKARGEKAAP